MTARGSKTNEPGIDDQFQIDDDTFDMPVTGGYVADAPLQQMVFQSMAGGGTLSLPYRGAGMPDRSELFTFELPYEIDDTNSDLADKLELLRATIGPHFLADWKQRPYVYSFRPNQAFAYLPREDAYARWGGGTPAEITIGVTPVATIVYQSSVAESDVVPDGEAWIASTAIRHPLSGLYVAPFKLGTPPVAAKRVIVRYIPVFRGDVVNMPTTFTGAGQEGKHLYFQEIN
jgi:hypothetical protein